MAEAGRWTHSLCALSLSCIVGLLTPQWGRGQDADSLRHYDLAEIVVEDGDTTASSIQSSLFKLRIADIATSDAQSMAHALMSVPGMHVQVNSRGEALPYLRSAGERQVALYLDGALLNIPWDNRFNLRGLPSGMIGETAVIQGVPSVVYGTNVTGGVVSMLTRLLDSDGRLSTAKIGIGDQDHRSAELHNFYSREGLKTAVGFSYAESGNFNLPDGSLAFSQTSTSRRTNTDTKIGSVFGKSQLDLGKHSVGLTAAGYWSQLGVAPESHIDPELGSVRYWRIPDQSNVLVVGNSRFAVGNRSVRTALWYSSASQEIEQFEDEAYVGLADVELSDDHTFGARITGDALIAGGNLTYALNGHLSRHREWSNQDPTRLEFTQQSYSVGAEYVRRMGQGWFVSTGASFDGLGTPRTGDKPPRGRQAGVGASASLLKKGEAGTVRLSLGQRVRFPTMRELFGEALQRFLLNPDLKEERSIVAEIGLSRERSSYVVEIVPFVRRTHDTIDQERVVQDSTTFRRRINLDGSWTTGIEASGSFAIGNKTRGRLSLYFADTKVIGVESGVNDLVEKPRSIIFGQLSYRIQPWLSITPEVSYMGRAYGREEDNSLEALPRSTIVNLRLSSLVLLNRTVAAEGFFRMRNVFDTLRLPQLGLPEAGRSIVFGIDFSF